LPRMVVLTGTFPADAPGFLATDVEALYGQP
jgi:hypothetical protein